MRNILSILLAVAVLCVCSSCENGKMTPSSSSRYVFNIAVNDDIAATKAGHTKTSWESGDRIFVFFNAIIKDEPVYLCMTYDGSRWNSVPSSENDVAAILDDYPEGTLSAFYASNAGTDCEIRYDNADREAYLLDVNGGFVLACDGVPYTVDDAADGIKSLDATLKMQGDGFVQFFVPDVFWTDKCHLKIEGGFAYGVFSLNTASYMEDVIGFGDMWETLYAQQIDGGALFHVFVPELNSRFATVLEYGEDHVAGPFTFTLSIVSGSFKQAFRYKTSEVVCMKNMDAVCLPSLENSSAWTPVEYENPDTPIEEGDEDEDEDL